MLVVVQWITKRRHYLEVQAYSTDETINKLYCFNLLLNFNLPAMQKTWVRSLGWDDPLEKGMATHSTTHAWRKPMDRGAGQSLVHEIIKSQA